MSSGTNGGGDAVHPAGAPWENGYAESFHSRFRDEFLAIEEFESLRAARQLTAAGRDGF